MSARGWSLVCYDIREGRRLRKVAKLLEGYGERVQYSVFRMRLTRKEEEELRWKLTRLTEAEDSFLIVALCGACGERVRARDTREVWGEDPKRVAVL